MSELVSEWILGVRYTIQREVRSGRNVVRRKGKGKLEMDLGQALPSALLFECMANMRIHFEAVWQRSAMRRKRFISGAMVDAEAVGENW